MSSVDTKTKREVNKASNVADQDSSEPSNFVEKEGERKAIKRRIELEEEEE